MMKSTFHEVELGKAVVQNATESGTEQLIVTLNPDHKFPVQLQIRQNTGNSSEASPPIAIDQHGLQQLFQWLREEDALP
ncbi:hypothetical protein [Noviherbaspirillum agri]